MVPPDSVVGSVTRTIGDDLVLHGCTSGYRANGDVLAFVLILMAPSQRWHSVLIR